ncbi:MAG: glyceraldehyde-3-phosphate dehydrogenase, partial [Patescibacteria group bacterium]
HFTSSQSSQAHLNAGAKRVIISAPAKDEATQTMVYGTDYSDECIKKGKCKPIISMASCTTNCIAPAIQVLESSFGVEKAIMTTVHAYTSTQNLVDGPSQEISRTRASANNLIPTSTGAAIATTKVIPKLQNKFDGISIRVPVICGSLSDITAVLKKSVTVEEVNKAFKDATKTPMFKGILAVSNDHRVSSDYIGDSHSSIIDLEFTRVVGGNLVKVLAWYDNELAYSTRLVEMSANLK